jgi:hypothetical protein
MASFDSTSLRQLWHVRLRGGCSRRLRPRRARLHGYPENVLATPSLARHCHGVICTDSYGRSVSRWQPARVADALTATRTTRAFWSQSHGLGQVEVCANFAAVEGPLSLLFSKRTIRVKCSVLEWPSACDTGDSPWASVADPLVEVRAFEVAIDKALRLRSGFWTLRRQACRAMNSSLGALNWVTLFGRLVGVPVVSAP